MPQLVKKVRSDFFDKLRETAARLSPLFYFGSGFWDGVLDVRRRGGRPCPPRMTAAPLTYPTSAGAEPPLFLPPAGDFCQQRQKSPKTPLETAFQDFLSRVGYDFALTRPTRNRLSGFSRFKGLCLHSFPRCAVARRCPLPRWVPWCSTARVPADIPSRRATLSAPHDHRAP